MTDTTLGRGRAALRNLPAAVLIGVLRVYQSVISPLTGPTCKYYPSCSQYAIIAIRTHGTLRGTGLALWRILRCNPWSLGGVDDVPPARSQHVDGDAVDHEHRGAARH